MNIKTLLAALVLAAPVHAQEVSVTVNLSEKAIKVLEEKNAYLGVTGFFSGKPAKDATLKPDESGVIFLISEDYTVRPKSVTLTFGKALASAPLDQVVEPFLYVEPYPYMDSQDKIITCGAIDNTFAALTAGPQTIDCKAIGE
jgi:hypothetical protein